MPLRPAGHFRLLSPLPLLATRPSPDVKIPEELQALFRHKTEQAMPETTKPVEATSTVTMTKTAPVEAHREAAFKVGGAKRKGVWTKEAPKGKIAR